MTNYLTSDLLNFQTLHSIVYIDIISMETILFTINSLITEAFHIVFFVNVLDKSSKKYPKYNLTFLLSPSFLNVLYLLDLISKLSY